MPEKRYMIKKDAVAYISEQTGAGRHVIDQRMTQLLYQGIIVVEDDPMDNRRKRISVEDVERIIQFLRGGGREASV